MLIAVDETTSSSRYLRGYRVASEVSAAADGTRTVQVAAEPDWFSWAIGASPGENCPNTKSWPVELVWAER